MKITNGDITNITLGVRCSDNWINETQDCFYPVYIKRENDKDHFLECLIVQNEEFHKYYNPNNFKIV